MRPEPFKLERYFAKYEFQVKYLLSASDCESLSLAELLERADPETSELWEMLKLGYTESSGHPLLRAEISNLYGSIKPDDVMIAAPEEAIFIIMHVLLKPGDHVVCVSPAYQSLYEIPRAMGCTVTPWRFELNAGRWHLDLERLRQIVNERTRLLVVNFPHNPTGYLASRDEFESVVEIARRHDLYILSDEMYRLLEYEAEDRLPPVCDLAEKGISLSGLSKSFALPGLRLGWLATRSRAVLEQMVSFKDYTTICNSAPGEILGLIALRARDSIIARNLSIIRENLRVAEEFFSEHAETFGWIAPLAGSIAFPRWLGRIPVDQFCEEMVAQHGVMVVPGSIFDFPGDYFRLGLGRRNLPEALERVRNYLGS